MATQTLVGKNENGLRHLDPARDLTQLADLIENAFAEELSDDGGHVLQELRFLGMLGPLNIFVTGMQSEVDDLFTGYVWVQGRQVVGNVTVNRPTGHPRRWQISNVAVLDAYRRQGIAHKLVKAAIDLILCRGGDTAYLYVREDNDPARRLYESLGFVEVDRTTDLKFDAGERLLGSDVVLLRPIRSSEREKLYRFILETDSEGHRWMSPVRHDQFVFSDGEHFSRMLESLFSGELETCWGAFSGGSLDAALALRSTFGLNRKPHHFRLWVRPGCRGQIEGQIACDIISILAQKTKRPVRVSLPVSESFAIDALVQQGFHKLRTLVLMKLDL